MPSRVNKPGKSASDYQKLEDVIGCKWSVSVLTTVAAAIIRPGEIERSIKPKNLS